MTKNSLAIRIALCIAVFKACGVSAAAKPSAVSFDNRTALVPTLMSPTQHKARLQDMVDQKFLTKSTAEDILYKQHRVTWNLEPIVLTLAPAKSAAAKRKNLTVRFADPLIQGPTPSHFPPPITQDYEVVSQEISGTAGSVAVLSDAIPLEAKVISLPTPSARPYRRSAKAATFTAWLAASLLAHRLPVSQHRIARLILMLAALPVAMVVDDHTRTRRVDVLTTTFCLLVFHAYINR